MDQRQALITFWRETLLILFGLVISIALGLWLDSTWLPATIYLVLVVISYMWRLHTLYRWVQQPSADIPETVGLWQSIYSRFFHQNRLLDRHRQRLKKYLKQYRDSMAALSDGVIFLDANGRITWFNAAAEQLVGLEFGHDKGQKIDHLLRHAQLSEFLIQADAGQRLRITAPHQDGLTLSLTVVSYSENERFLFIRDVSLQERSEQVRRDFIANASHELRTPLTVVRGYAEALVDDYSTDSVEHEALHAINTQALRMQRILDDMLLLARLESLDYDATEEHLDIVAMLETAQLDAQVIPQSQAQRVTVTGDTAWGLRGQRMDIRSVIQNLLVNALKYAGENAQITLRWEVNADGGAISVEDNGIGISPEHTTRLTERFYRIDPNRDAKTGGTGLGLAIVKHAIENHQGQLIIDSELGQGTTFHCRFPRLRLVGLTEERKV